MAQYIDLAGHRGAHDQFLREIDKIFKHNPLPDETGIQRIHGPFLSRIHEQAVS